MDKDVLEIRRLAGLKEAYTAPSTLIDDRVVGELKQHLAKILGPNVDQRVFQGLLELLQGSIQDSYELGLDRGREEAGSEYEEY